MFRRIAPALICLALAGPAAAQEPEEPGLIDQGMQLFLRGLMQEIEPELQDMGDALRAMEPLLRQLIALAGDLGHYQAPERLPNGDIILRRKPDAPPPPPLPDPPGTPAPGIDL